MDNHYILVIISLSVCGGIILTKRSAINIFKKNRELEFPENERSDPLSRQSLHWTIVHIRDDMPLIVEPLNIISGLLAGILAALIVMILR